MRARRWPLAPNCQKKRRGQERRGQAAKRRGKGANFIPTCGQLRPLFPFRAVAGPGADQVRPPGRRRRQLPSPLSPGSPCAAGAREVEGDPRGRNSGGKALREAAKLRAARGGGVSGGGALCAGPDAGFWRGLPSSSLSLGLGLRPAGERTEAAASAGTRGESPFTAVGDTQPTESPCPEDAETQAAESALTRRELKDIS